MTIRKVLVFPDSRLRNVAKEVTTFDEQLKVLASDMAETMYAEKGIGLAATQVNVALRVVTIDLSEDKSGLTTLVNPVITAKSGEQVCQEGCLSVPEVYADVTRAEKVTVEALDIDGNKLTIEADELLAVCIQHEIDHLDGKVFIDYLSPAKRQRIQKKMLKRK